MALYGRAVHLVATSVALVSLAATAVILRFTARQRRHLPYKKDDWLSLLGQVLLFAMLVESILWVALGGAGKHWTQTTPREKEQFFKIFFSSQITYIALTPIIKITVISFYQRIFDVRRFRIVTNILMIVIALYFLGHFIFAVGFTCRPLRKAWDPTSMGTCAAPLPALLAFQGVSIAFDFVILALPMPMCWKLHRPWQDRLAILAVFLVGAFVCAASIARLDTLLKIDHSDLSYSIYDATVWTLVEPCIGQVCACLPVARGLLPAFNKSLHARAGSSIGNEKHNHVSIKGRILNSSKNVGSLHHGEKMSSNYTHFHKSDDKPLVQDDVDSRNQAESFELRRSNSHHSKTSTQTREDATEELEMV